MALQYPKPIPAIFANKGSVTEEIPVSLSTTGSGRVSYDLGFPPETGLPLPPRGQGKPVARSDMNALFKLITEFMMYCQSGGMFNYDPSLSYKANQSTVLHKGVFYFCLQDNSPEQQIEPGTMPTVWQPLISYLQQQSASQVGNIIFRPTKKMPPNAIIADGRIVNIDQYPLLYAELGEESAEGCPEGQFKIPDLRGYFIRCADLEKGIDKGREVMTVQGDAIRNMTGQLGHINNFAALIGPQEGVFALEKWGTSTGIRASSQTDNYMTVMFDASRQVPTAEENRPINVSLVAGIIFE